MAEFIYAVCDLRKAAGNVGRGVAGVHDLLRLDEPTDPLAAEFVTRLEHERARLETDETKSSARRRTFDRELSARERA